jgi:hypothetical protein
MEYGLLCEKDAFHATLSPDAIAVLEIPYVGQVTALVEIKSKCTTVTVQKETSLAQQYASLKLVVVHGTSTAQKFSRVYSRTGPLHSSKHGIACGDLQEGALYIVLASLRIIIRVVHVHLHEDAKDSCRLALQEVYERNLTWIPTGKFPACWERCSTLPPLCM